MEATLARFWRKHLAGPLQARSAEAAAPGYQVLLGGLSRPEEGPAPHAVYSVDWYHPTLGERAAGSDAHAAVRFHGRADERRRVLESACRRLLEDSPRRLAQFDTLLTLAQHYARVREEQCREFTLAWPVLRRCASRLGTMMSEAGIIAEPEDIHFLLRDELDTAGPRRVGEIARRRSRWIRQRKLQAPLTLGKLPPLLGNVFDRLADSARAGQTRPRGAAVVGHPASPGRAAGPVRIILGQDDFDRFEAGEGLVAKATAPAWTPLFARAAAVVTDGGTLAAHASLVAREFGIPAVVGTGNATERVSTGQYVTVDGSVGTVELQ